MDTKDFKVVDKRRFTETGEQKAGMEEPEKAQDARGIPPVDFSTFILSLSASVLLHLGEIPDPQTQKMAKSLELAKHTIDIIDMLKQKTKGNMTEAEARLMDNILYDLKMRYVNVSK